MKIERQSGRRAAFTLIELLVVIGIIAMLAALLLPAIHFARAHARRVVAQTEVNQIAAAWKHYYSEYQRWPVEVVDESAMPLKDEFGRILWAGELGPSNPRRIRFVQFNRMHEDNPVSPWWREGEAGDTFRYFVRFDQNFDNEILGSSVDDPPTNVVRDALVVWTFNRDVPPDDKNYIIGSWKE